MLLPLTALAVAISELLLPMIFATDGEQAVMIGRWFLFTIVVVVGLELNYGLLLGTHDFFAYNVAALRPAAAGRRGAGRAVGGGRPHRGERAHRRDRRHCPVVWRWAWRAASPRRRGPLDLHLGLPRSGTGFAGRATRVAANVTARLDVAMLPAFVRLGQRGPLLGGHQHLVDRLPAVEHLRRAGAARPPRASPSAGRSRSWARSGPRWPWPPCWPASWRCSRGP